MRDTFDMSRAKSSEWYAICFIVGLTAARLVWHLFQPIGMAGDETYYWLWGQYPDWGYFSKPPMIGWLYGAMTEVLGQSVFIYKGFAALLGAGTLWFFYRIVVLMTGRDELALWGLLAFGLMPANLLQASILTIDAPLMFFWAGGMFFTARLLIADSVRSTDYLGLWVMLAMGHLSKQMMLVQLALIPLVLLLYRRELFRDIRLWLALLGSLLALVPPLVWNSQNEWITLAHTAHHFNPSSPALAKSLSRLAELWGALAGLVSPILFALFFPALRTVWAQRKERAMVFFFIFGGAAMIVMSAMAFRQRVNPNWPAVFLLGSLGMILVWASSAETRMCWLKRGTKLGAILSACLMIFLLFLEPLSQPLADIGIKPQRRGWQGYPQLVEQVASLPDGADQLMFVGHRFAASHFAFYGADPKRVHLWYEDPTVIHNQFYFFDQPEVGKPILIVVERKRERDEGVIPKKLQAMLLGVELLDEFQMHPARDFPRFQVYRADQLLAWHRD
ncbi:MAG: ArnT family glycosyltransferase [Lentimonas sp.]